jgi:endonuclease/exonuclease/phosphatase (EEP) superfamily protein YafD
VAGDLNTWWGDEEPAVRDLRRVLPDARAPKSPATWGGGMVRTIGGVDHMFAKLDDRLLNVVRLSARFGSDHHPILAIVEAKELRN